MNKLILTVAALLAATQVSAGVRIETLTRDVKTQVADGGAQVVMVQDGKIRMSNPKHGNGMILKNTVLYLFDDQRKTYSEIDKATLKKAADQAGAAMAQMQERLKSMPPEQRAQMEKMLGANMPGAMSGKPDTYETRDTGKSETAEGRKCRVWNLIKNGALHEELCVVPYSSLPGKEDFEKAFSELAESAIGMAGNLPGATAAIESRRAVDGFPVRVRHFDAAGKPRGIETVLTQWVEESLPASTFEIPAGYTKKELPTMGR
ncbi:MAG TPA: DUF4412 domain-containing protein [Steroidobacteraceae bacterium]|nr:DUF4412 domain-containing protein [Steroidobacteraceae bacterium]